MKTTTPSYQRHRFPSVIISHAVWLYHRFCLSFREVEELLAERGIIVTYETVRQWCQKFGRNQRAAERFFRRLLKGQGGEPHWLITDKLRSYDAAHRTVMPTVSHINHVYANNRAEVSHQPTRQREYHMRGFSSSIQAQRFLTLHGLTQNLFRLGRHLMQAVNHRILRAQAFQVWKEAVCA
jgi:putative transposase